MNFIFLFLTLFLFSFISLFITLNMSLRDIKKELIVFFFLILILIATDIFIFGILGYLTSINIFFSALFLFTFCLIYCRKKDMNNIIFQFLHRLTYSFWALVNELKFDKFVIFLSIFFVLHIGLAVFLVYLFPPHAFDDLWYHLVTIASWIHNGKITLPNYSIWTKTYPFNAELVYTFVPLFLKNDTWIDLAQFPFTMTSILVIYSLTRSFQISRKYSYVSAISFFFIPTVFAQSITAYTDIAFTSLFLTIIYFSYEYYKKMDFTHLLLISISSGFFLGIKFSSFVYLFIVVFICIILPIIFKLKKKLLTLKVFITHSLTFIGISILYGSFWYLRTWYYFKSPIYPFLVKFHNIVIFKGFDTVDNLIMENHVPPIIKKYGTILRFLQSWFMVNPTSYKYDSAIGGLGFIWLFVLIPSFLFSIYFLIRNYKVQVYFIFIPIIITFILQPANWWARYTLSILVIGTISFAFILDKKLFKKRRIMKYFNSLLKFFMVLILPFEFLLYTLLGDYNILSIDKFLHLPKVQRTVGELNRPMFEWVYHLNGKSNIGYVPTFSFRFDSPYFTNETIYPFFGFDFQNQPINLTSKNRESFFHLIKINKIQYISIPKDSIYDKWIKEKNSSFISIDTKYDTFDRHFHVVYQVKKQT